MIDTHALAAGGLTEQQVIEIRRIKARVEAERLPRGADPALHTKLGPGGLADVEWTVQLLQMQYGSAVPALQTTSTLAALSAAAADGVIDAQDAEVLRSAWLLATSIRDAIMVAKGRPSDSLPRDSSELRLVAGVLGYRPGAPRRSRRGLPPGVPSISCCRRKSVLREGVLYVTDQLAAGSAQYRAVLGNTELVALLAARVLSGIGDQLARVVLALYVLDRSNGNALLAALVLAVSYLPSTFGFAFLGSLADRFPRRAVMLWTDLSRALLVTALALAVARDAGFVAVLLLLTAETFSAPALSARSSLLPEAARSPVEHQAVVGLGNTFEQAIQVVGFLVAGVALGLTSPAWVLLFNAITFLISYLIILAFVDTATNCGRVRHQRPSHVPRYEIWAAHHREDPIPWRCRVAACGPPRRCWSPPMPWRFPTRREAGARPGQATVLLAATPAGAAIGSLLVARLPMQHQMRLVFPLAIASTIPDAGNGC